MAKLNELATDIEVVAIAMKSRQTHRRLELVQCTDEARRFRTLLAARLFCFDPNEHVRTDAVEALEDYGSAQDWYRVTALMRDPSWIVRSSAAEVAGRMFRDRAAVLLGQLLLRDRHYLVRKGAAAGLRDCDDEPSLRFLVAAAESEKDLQPLSNVYAALVARGKEQYLLPLLGLLQTPIVVGRDRALISTVLDSISSLVGLMTPEEARVTLDALVGLSEDELPSIRLNLESRLKKDGPLQTQ